MASISVIIPVFNGQRFLAAAIESVLAQTLKPCEIVVVDDGSTDDSFAIAQCYGEQVRVLSQANAGVASARNAGIRATTGEYVALLDADDLMMPNRLQLQAASAASSNAHVTLCQQWLFHDGQPASPSTNTEEMRRCLRPGMAPSCAFVQRGAFDQFGLFPSIRLGEFIVWFDRATKLGCRHEIISAPLVLRRLHGESLSQTSRADYANVVKMLRGARTSERRAA